MKDECTRMLVPACCCGLLESAGRGLLKAVSCQGNPRMFSTSLQEESENPCLWQSSTQKNEGISGGEEKIIQHRNKESYNLKKALKQNTTLLLRRKWANCIPNCQAVALTLLGCHRP